MKADPATVITKQKSRGERDWTLIASEGVLLIAAAKGLAGTMSEDSLNLSGILRKCSLDGRRYRRGRSGPKRSAAETRVMASIPCLTC